MNKGFEVETHDSDLINGTVYAPDDDRVCRCKQQWAYRIAAALNSVPPKVDLPTVPGWYWFKDEHSGNSYIADVWRNDKTGRMMVGAISMQNFPNGEWRGPLVDPWAGEDSHV